MIYIFQGCGAVLKAPSICCKAAAKAFDAACKGCSQACQACCKSISDLWAPILQNPLGGYVVGTLATMIVAVAACAVTLADEATQGCTDLHYFCLADIGIAVVHSAFALYIQRRLVRLIGKEGKASMTHGEITEKAKELLKYDIGFCLYFFFFIAAFCFNCYGVTDLKCADSSYQRAAVGLMLVYGVGAWHFACCWYCGQCCFGKAEKRGVVKVAGGGSEGAAPSPAAGLSSSGPALDVTDAPAAV